MVFTFYQKRRINGGKSKRNVENTSSEKKLFRENPTPLHQHPIYSSNPQQLAAFSNIRKPYTNPTSTLHPNLNFSEIQVN